jgi:hypothetical protein
MGRLIVGSLVLTALTVTSAPALAGPPLICHPFDIGPAASLPVGTSGGWASIDPAYDRTRLVDDTLGLLTPNTPVIVRMETIRRASLYVRHDGPAAERLLQAVHGRATGVPRSAREASAAFDAGYLIETYRQLGVFEPALQGVVGGLDGYALVTAAIRFWPDDAAMAFAAALITSNNRGGGPHMQHVRRARELAPRDSLVARNLRTHFAG